MKLAIMQPYLFPYIGYFQLVAAVDKFVFYDDVNFIKNGWINRNQLFLSGKVRYFTIPLMAASSFSKINTVCVHPEKNWQKRILDSVRLSYSKAPFFKEGYDILSEVILAASNQISVLASMSVIRVAEYLSLETEFVRSSAVYGNEALAGSARIIDICQRENASHYYNLPGGMDLYSDDQFKSNQITLNFIESDIRPYRQLDGRFEPFLSIIDVIMFHPKEAIYEMLQTAGWLK